MTDRLAVAHAAGASGAEPASLEPLTFLKGFVALVRAIGLYPAGHPLIEQSVRAAWDLARPTIDTQPVVALDIIEGTVHLDGRPFRHESHLGAATVREVLDFGIDSLHLHHGLRPDEIRLTAEFLAVPPDRREPGPLDAALARRGVAHVSLARILPLDTRRPVQAWPEAPTGPLDPDYAESLQRTAEALQSISAGRSIGSTAVRDLLQLLLLKVARSQAALGQILAVKQYENHTYCHSVNVAIISLLIGREVGLDDAAAAALVEGAVLHDVGKTRIPLDIIKKPGALTRRERRIIERHPSAGAALLLDVPGLAPLTPTLALEHHRHWRGGGYPDLGADVAPHLLSQIVTVADVYEALTGARTYRDPMFPEQACLVLARLSGQQLNPTLVRAFFAAVTFFPLGSVVRTNLGEVGVVVGTNPADPLHPIISVDAGPAGADAPSEIDTGSRDSSGAYCRHIVETLRPADAVLGSAA